MGHKVLFITFWYPTSENKVNGIFIKEHARSLAQEGHELVILHFDIAYAKGFFSIKNEMTRENETGSIYSIKIRSKFWKWIYHGIPLLNILAARAYRKITGSGFHPQIIHANVIFPSGLVGYFLSKKYKIPAVLSEHWSGFEHFCHHPLFGRITRKAVSHYKYIMPVSKHLGEIIRIYKPDDRSIIVVPNVVDNKVYTVKSPKKESSRLSFLVVANWQTRKIQAKRPDLVTDALRLFAQQTDKKVVLNVVGEGELLAGIKAECHNYNFDCVFYGYLDKKSINQLLHETDFFLHASNFETFSVVTVEALLTGTPAIVSDLPALRELVNPDNGILVKNNVREWAEAIKSAVNKEWDHEKIATQIREKFTYNIVGQKFTTIYNDLTDKSLPLLNKSIISQSNSN